MTERAEHTAGPWKQQCFLVTGGDGSWVCHTGMGNLPPSRSHESEANARLIAAAPDLLAALKVALPRLAHKASCHTVRPTSEWEKHGSSCFDECDCEIKVVRAAISRATGEA